MSPGAIGFYQKAFISTVLHLEQDATPDSAQVCFSDERKPPLTVWFLAEMMKLMRWVLSVEGEGRARQTLMQVNHSMVRHGCSPRSEVAIKGTEAAWEGRACKTRRAGVVWIVAIKSSPTRLHFYIFPDPDRVQEWLKPQPSV